MSLQLTASTDQADLLFLPWEIPLGEWPADTLVALPRGISRHVVRFVRVGGVVYAVKETLERLARREYELLFDLGRRRVPCVDPIAVVTGRTSPTGEELPAALVTQHLQFSLPYRALFSTTLRPNTAVRLLDALALLLVRLHLSGFSWGDCSLSNTLFRRDAGAFAAYLVDAETGDIYHQLSDGRREYDLQTAETNVSGELMDIEASGRLHPSVDPIKLGIDVRVRYERLWDELTREIVVSRTDRHELDGQIRRLNRLGFDVAELSMQGEAGGAKIRVTPKVVDAGHHSRRLLRLTGLDVEENQARRLLNDLDTYRAVRGLPDADEELAAHRWVSDVFEPVVGTVPRELRGKLEPAQMFHEVLEHRWFLSEQASQDVGIEVAARAYVDNVLAHKPDERAVLGPKLGNSDIEGVQFIETVEHHFDFSEFESD
jgi:hypothetical protein